MAAEAISGRYQGKLIYLLSHRFFVVVDDAVKTAGLMRQKTSLKEYMDSGFGRVFYSELSASGTKMEPLYI